MNLNVTLAALVMLAAASAPLVAQTATAVQTGEQVTGARPSLPTYVRHGALK